MRAWGKTSKTGAALPLETHLADVAACFERLLAIPAIWRGVARQGQDDAQLRARLCVFAFLHDFGKLNTWFQARGWAEAPQGWRAGHLREALHLYEEGDEAILLALGLGDILDWGPAAESFLRAMLAHHGAPITTERAAQADAVWRAHGDYDPLAEATRIGAAARAAYPAAFAPGPPLPDDPELQHYFAGLLAVADQIGSREDIFPFDRSAGDDVSVRAAQALAALQIDVAALREAQRDPAPARMFGWDAGSDPKPMQKALRDAPLPARLIALESETGSGKTEAAFLRFQRLFAAGAVDALYFAVPTRAAAAGLHDRIAGAARAMLGVEAVLAVPGYTQAGAVEGHALPEYQVKWDDDPSEARKLSRWAAETPRRYLGAVVAVGTVDQAMLAGLRTKWAHFRAALLSRALLVVDEAHASDVYMQAVLSGVLRAHVARGGHALLMSATLGAAARARWLCGPRAKAVPDAPYPALSWAEGRTERHQPLAHDGRSKTVVVEAAPLIADPDAIAAWAAEAAAQGARVLVIRNTVDQAVAVQRALEALGAPTLQVERLPAPHHGRYAAEDRKLLDAAVEAAFGKDAEGGSRVVVGSQTLEQSLDLDADLLLCDLCPIDVLLQRIGRLHRHHARDPVRPHGFAEARCVVLTPETLAPDADLLRFGLGPNSEHRGVYPDLTALEATRRLIAGRPRWTIPADNRALVEAGTDPATLEALAQEMGPVWEKALRGTDGKDLAEGLIALRAMLDRAAPFDGRSELFLEDEKILTRLGGDRRILTLPEGTIGPFGQEARSLSVSEWLLGGADAEAEPEIESTEGGFLLRLGQTRLRYDRMGLAKG